MGRTTEVAADRAYDQTKTVLPAEVAQGVYMQNAPGLAALKLMHLMIGIAGGRMADDVQHTMSLADIRKIDGMDNHTRASITPLFAELAAAVLIHDDTEKKRVRIGGMIDDAEIDYREESTTGHLVVSWYFGRTFRRMAQESNHWAILDRQAVFHLGSKYSVLLFQHIASLQNLKHKTSKRFTVSELRAVFGIPEGKLTRFSNFNTWAIKAAVDEINSDLTRLHLTVNYHKIGRTVAEVEIAWEVKADLAKVKDELDRPKVGRKARRDGTAEIPVIVFPASGSVKDTQPWDRIARDNAPRIDGRHVPDLRNLADTFRRWCGEKSIPLDGSSIEKTFTTWCKSYSAR
ncbi:RepB family plasmid replication initiator protein [Sulfitobacter sp. M220]|nr:RepB family plasmid replication initiator protein [Sulfitobacter sp. M220]